MGRWIIVASCVCLGLASQPARAQGSAVAPTATLLVWVISAKTALPLEGSRLAMTLRGDTGVVTDSVGRALVRGLARRADILVVRHPGYQARSFPLALQSDDSLELTVALEPIVGVMLDTVVTSSRTGPSAALAPGFETRRKQGNGHFLDRAGIEKRNLRTLPELL